MTPLKIYTADVSFYEGYIANLAAEAAAGFAPAIDRLIAHTPRFQISKPEQIPAAQPDADDARWVYAREHGFDDWPCFVEQLEKINSGAVEEPFIAFIHACEEGNTQQVWQGLDRHPDLVTYNCSTHKTPLHSPATLEVAHILIQAGTPLTTETPLAGGTALVHALVWGWTDIAELIAEHDASPANLRVAAGLGRIELLKTMFSTDSSLKQQARQGRAFYRGNYGWFPWTPTGDDQEILDEGLIYAACNGRVEAMDFLLSQGANPNGKAYETTALLRATWKGQRQAVDWLLDHGANINATGGLGGHAQGATAIHIAASQGDRALVEHLVARGADLTLRDLLYNGTPDGWAKQYKHDELAQYLYEQQQARN